MNNFPENPSTNNAAESLDIDAHADVTIENLFNVLTDESARAAKLQLCAVCVQDQAVTPSLLCTTCISVDDMLAESAGSRHLLPHIWTNRLDEQPRSVMACAVHRLHYPNDTGFYGVYTTMNRIMRRSAREAVAATRRRIADANTSAADVAASLQPSRVNSLAMLESAAGQMFPELRPWLIGLVAHVRPLCEQQDNELPVTLTDYQRARIATVLR